MSRILGAWAPWRLDEVDRPTLKVKRDQGLGIRCLGTSAPWRLMTQC
jgi:hypothetical protein